MIQVKHLTHTFRTGKAALLNVSCQFKDQGLTAIIGPSGAGKSTLLRCLNGLVRPRSGEVVVNGIHLEKLQGQMLRDQQRQIGMVFQQFNLITRRTALENVLNGKLGSYPIWKSTLGLFSNEDRQEAVQLLERVGMADFALRRVSQLSGGQQQRVAIARALMQRPHVILADEPVSALDPRSTEAVMQILTDIHHRDGIQVIVNLHDLSVVREYTRHILALRDGQVLFETESPHLTEDLIRQLYYGKEHEVSRAPLEALAFV